MKNKFAVLAAIMMLLLVMVVPVFAVIAAQLLTIKLAGGHVARYALLIVVANMLGLVVDLFTNWLDRLYETLLKRWAWIYLVMLVSDWVVAMAILAVTNAWWFHLNLDLQMVGVLAGVGSIVGGALLWIMQQFDHDDDAIAAK
ncbi:hypothetical protein [Lacticaseibacillus hulanensis]|uniref:hypothetical protein n=1 Tax=Lacticaseibacillus hulanensis TaxID=2493111 RepID=UPI000FD7B8D7|nr:hypothetical protein [Lacticaseibacillus hulanensis]